MKTPLLSVVIPAYNRAHFLSDTISSVLRQQDVEVEVIVVDDGSTDNTRSLVEQAAGRDPSGRVRYIWQENAERCVARNNGLHLARGEFVAFLDSDDVWRENHAPACVAALHANPSAIAAYGECGLISADGRPIRNLIPRRAATATNLCLKRCILHPTEMVFRREWLLRHKGGKPFDSSVPGAEDWLLCVEVARAAAPVRVPIATVWMRLHSDNTYGDPRKFERSLLLAARKVVETGLPEKLGIRPDRILAINHLHVAYVYYLSAASADARRHLRFAVATYPQVVLEPDFWMVLLRLAVGSSLGRRIRERRNRPPDGTQRARTSEATARFLQSQ